METYRFHTKFGWFMVSNHKISIWDGSEIPVVEFSDKLINEFEARAGAINRCVYRGGRQCASY